MKNAVKCFVANCRNGNLTAIRAADALHDICNAYGTEAVAGELVKTAPDVCRWLDEGQA